MGTLRQEFIPCLDKMCYTTGLRVSMKGLSTEENVIDNRVGNGRKEGLGRDLPQTSSAKREKKDSEDKKRAIDGMSLIRVRSCRCEAVRCGEFFVWSVTSVTAYCPHIVRTILSESAGGTIQRANSSALSNT